MIKARDSVLWEFWNINRAPFGVLQYCWLPWINSKSHIPQKKHFEVAIFNLPVKILRKLCLTKPGIMPVSDHRITVWVTAPTSLLKQGHPSTIYEVFVFVSKLGRICGFDLSHNLSNNIFLLTLTQKAAPVSTKGEGAHWLLYLSHSGVFTGTTGTEIPVFPTAHTPMDIPFSFPAVTSCCLSCSMFSLNKCPFVHHLEWLTDDDLGLGKTAEKLEISVKLYII